MNAWKSSTLLVLAAFALSVVLLIVKSGMIAKRNQAPPVVVTNQVYSPAAADPELRSPERAERLTRRTPKAKAVVERVKKNVPPPKKDEPKAQVVQPQPQSTQQSISTTEVPSDHKFYVVAATFSSSENAQRGLQDFKNKGLKSAFIGTFDEGKFYSIISNTYKDELSARYRVKQLQEKHSIKAYVYHKKDEE